MFNLQIQASLYENLNELLEAKTAVYSIAKLLTEVQCTSNLNHKKICSYYPCPLMTFRC